MRRRRDNTGQARAGDLAFSLLRHLPGAPEGLALMQLWSRWNEAVGEDLAAWAHPLGSRGGVLLVGVEDNMGLNELVFYAPQILYDVHAFLGQNLFDSVHGELLMGRIPLDAASRPAPPRPRLPEVAVGRDPVLAELARAELAKGNSPWATAYQAYVRLLTGGDPPF